MKYLRTLLLAGLLTAVAACQPQGSGSVASSGTAVGDGEGAKPVATVNGTVISRDFFDFYARGSVGKPAGDLSDDQRTQLLDNLIRAVAVGQQASKDGLEKNKDTVALVELTRLNVLQQAESNNFLKDRKPTEQELRKEYEIEVQQLPKTEYHAKHILVATEPFAQKAVERLEKGEKFDAVAKAESMDPSKDNGGDLGWFSPERMDKEFADALLTLKPGEFTKKPVHTQYGWHVIQLIETRDVAAPPFDNVRQRLDQVVQSRKFRAYADDLVSKSKIEKTGAQNKAASDAKPEAKPDENKKG
jgi:peptidyl-prolyl cis-trans isomerase C